MGQLFTRYVFEQGVNAEYDAAEEHLAAADAKLTVYLKELRCLLGAGKEVCYVALNKETHVIEVPEVFPMTVPRRLASRASASCGAWLAAAATVCVC